ncbi:MAG: glycosyltransferase family 2 protein [bacterium]|nr:glycosyltransferase family 2 protein [bacterium]
MIIYTIILNYKTKDETLKCIDSIEKCSMPSGYSQKIIVVDNASSDGIERAITGNHPDIQFIQTGANLGYTGGNNAGIRWVMESGEHESLILIVNNDTYFSQNFLPEMIGGLKKHPKAGIISPKIYFTKNSWPTPVLDKDKKEISPKTTDEIIWYAGGIFDWDNIIGGGRGVDQVDQGQFDREEQIEVATGCAMLIPFSVIKKIKGFDNKYFMYYEDVDLSVRIKRLGYELWYVPKAIMWHENAGSSGVGSPLQEYFQMRNRLLFAFKYAKPRTKLAVLREGIRMRNNPPRWKGVKDFLGFHFGKGTFEIN